jgi:hypothetical protein
MGQTTAIFIEIYAAIAAALTEMIRSFDLAGKSSLNALAGAAAANSGAIVTGLFTLLGVFIGYFGATHIEKRRWKYQSRKEAYSEFVTSVYKSHFEFGDPSRNAEAVLDGYAKIQLFGGSKVASKLQEMIRQRAGLKEVDYAEFAERVKQDLVPLMRQDLGEDVLGLE